MPEHVVKQGETLMAIADANGIATWQEILDRPENAELKKKRSDPGILKEGDKIFIPSREMKHQAAAVDAKHPFVIKKKKAWVRLALKDVDGKPLTGTYELTLDGSTTKGTIPPGGILEQAVALTASSGTLNVTTTDSRTESWTLKLAHMDPLDEESGIAARLANLGFARDDDDTASAVKAFQARIGLETTGAIDETLRTKLKSYYDPAQAEADLDVEPEEEEATS